MHDNMTLLTTATKPDQKQIENVAFSFTCTNLYHQFVYLWLLETTSEHKSTFLE